MINWIVQELGKVVPQPDEKYKQQTESQQITEVRLYKNQYTVLTPVGLVVKVLCGDQKVTVSHPASFTVITVGTLSIPS